MHNRNYLASQRRRFALSEQQLAELVGYSSRSTVYRFERGLRRPTLRFAIACEVIFGRHPRELFPHIYAKVEEDTLANAVKLDRSVRDKKGKAAARQRELLLGIAARAGNSAGA